MNRTLRAVDSLARYRSWVNMRTGPTGRERTVYGLYAPYGVTDERGAVEKALDAPPALPELDEAMRALVAANDRLAPTLTKANGYYERGDYKLDRMVEGKALHKLIATDGDAFLAARAKLERIIRVQKLALDQIRLATIEQRDGRKARWHVANVMMRGKQALDAFDVGPDGRVGLGGARRRHGAFRRGGARHGRLRSRAPPRVWAHSARFPDDLLSHMREVQGRLKRTKGNRAHSAGLDMTFIQSDWNTMVTTSDLPLAI